MSSRHQKGKPTFPAQHENLGGAHMILSDYVNLFNRAANAGPTRGVLANSRHTAPKSKAQELSRNRAARKAAVDQTAQKHMSNIHHLVRRIEGLYQPPACNRGKHGRTAHRPAHLDHLADLHVQLLQPWHEGHGYGTLTATPRPGSAPANWDNHQTTTRDNYQGWSVTNSLRNTFPADDFPETRYPNASVLEYAAYKNAIMDEIVANRMYKESQLKQLFKAYLNMAPLHDKQIVEDVTKELKRELLVS